MGRSVRDISGVSIFSKAHLISRASAIGPDLSPGASNTYRIRATWTVNGKEVTQERTATVAPGRGTVVDFTRPASEAIMPPAIK